MEYSGTLTFFPHVNLNRHRFKVTKSKTLFSNNNFLVDESKKYPLVWSLFNVDLVRINELLIWTFCCPIIGSDFKTGVIEEHKILSYFFSSNRFESFGKKYFAVAPISI